MVYIIIILCIIIIILSIRLYKKRQIENNELKEYNSKLEAARANLSTINYTCEEQNKRVRELESKYYTLLDQYKKELNKKSTDLDTYFENQKVLRQSELDDDFNRLRREKEQKLESDYQKLALEYALQEDNLRENSKKVIEAAQESQKNIIADTEYQQQRYEALLEPIKQYEMDISERIAYTVQVPEQGKEDIEYLLNYAAKKVHNPDIISKIIWSEYVKPYLDQTFKRIGIEEKPGIYKITNLDNGKSYIGKSTNVKRRITDHYKGACGINSISKQLVHDEMAATGLWNWTIEIIIYCEREQLSELEKYYINFFKTNEWGFNKTKGGEG